MKNPLQTMTGMLHSKNGMTLVELIVAMAISLVLAGSLYQIFISSTRTYALNEGLARLQENSRFAIKVLRRDIRQAGYLGCLQDNAAYTNTLNDPTDFLFNFDQAVYGLEATSATTWASELGPADPTTTGFNGMNLIDPVGGSDILAIRGMMGNQLFFLETPMPDTSADMKLEDGTTGIDDGDILMITDCQHASVFQTTNYTVVNGNLVHNTGTGTPGNLTKDLGHAYPPGAQLHKPATTLYFIAENATGQPSLFRKVGLAGARELVDGIENMQVRFGEDLDGDGAADTYVDGNAVTDWDTVVSVHIALLQRTVAEVPGRPADNSGYDVSGDGNIDFTAPGDRRLRRVLTTTIGLRNHLR